MKKKSWRVRKHYLSYDAFAAQERIAKAHTWDCVCGAAEIPLDYNCPFCGVEEDIIMAYNVEGGTR